MSDLRLFTLRARGLLTKEAGELLQQVYRLDAQTGARLSVPKGHLLESSPEAQASRKRIEGLLDDEVDAGLKREEAVAKLIKETAFTHLNRFVAFKLMEARGLVRSPLAKHHAANGFIMWLGSHPEEEARYNQGDSPNDRDGLGEAPRDRAYRHFLLWQCDELAKEIKVLFDPDNVPSLLFPRPGVLKELIDALNADDRKPDWVAGNEETVGWVYQYFNAEEKDAAFDRVFKKKKKFEKTDLAAATQVFTPRWVVRFLVENSLGRLWLAMHPDSQLGEKLAYLVPLPATPPSVAVKPVKEIRILDPATGTMHFGLVAFDLLTEMYREELTHAGTAGWPAQASVRNEAEIPAAILANNLFGIDIDLRAVQLAALALYLKAKATNKQSVLTESNLACADVAIFRGQHLNQITSEMALPGGFTRELFGKFRDSLEEASMMGSLVRLDKHFQNIQSDRLRQSIDSYVEKKRGEGVDESYFANETSKGLRLLNVLERRYDIVFTNPPYMSNRNMNAAMNTFLKRKGNYEKSSGDLYSAFIERCAEMLSPEGRLAMLTQQSFMFITTMDKLRRLLDENASIETMAHLGPKAFDEVKGEKVNVTAFVLRREPLEMERQQAQGVYFRLVKEPDADSKRIAFEQALARRRAGKSDPRVYEHRQRDFAAICGGPWVYWADSRTRQVFEELPQLGKVFEMDMGLKTSANPRFVRFWWEVGHSRIGLATSRSGAAALLDKKWFWYAKSDEGIGLARLRSVVNWHADGTELKANLIQKYPYLKGKVEWCTHNEDLYFRPCITWSPVSSTGFKARLVAEGAITSNAAYGIFVDSDRAGALYAYLTSLPGRYLIRILCSTINHNKGDLAKMPIPLSLLDNPVFRSLADQQVERYRSADIADETAANFAEPSRSVQRFSENSVDDQIDRMAFDALVLTQNPDFIRDFLSLPLEEGDFAADDDSEDEDDADVEDEAVAKGEDANTQDSLSYAVGIALGRFARAGLEHLIDAGGMMVVDHDHPDDLAQRVIDVLAAIHSEAEAARIVRTAIGGNGDLRDALASYLLGPFFKAHVKRYRKRPVYWLLQSPKQSFSVYLFQERATDRTLALLQGKPYLGGRMFQVNERSKQAKQKELTTEGKEKAQWKRKAQEAAEELSDLEALQQAIDATNSESIVDADGQPATARWVPEFDDGVLLNAAPLYRLTPAWKKADAKLDLSKVWKALNDGEYPWAKTAMRYWPRETLAACKDNKSYRIAHGLE
jgi:type I restriction-modification system DNA methylase subunit